MLTFILSHPVETNVRPIKNTFWCIKYAGYAYRSDWDTKPDLFTDSNMLLVDLAGVEPASRAPYFKAFTTILYLRLRARLAASRIRFLAIGLVIINSFVSIHYTAKYLAVQQFWLIKT